MTEEEENTWRRIVEASDRKPWEVRYETVDHTVHIYPGRGMGSCTGIFVRPPNALERILGITFESKVARAARRIQERVDRLEQKRNAEAKTRAMLARMREEGRIP